MVFPHVWVRPSFTFVTILSRTPVSAPTANVVAIFAARWLAGTSVAVTTEMRRALPDERISVEQLTPLELSFSLLVLGCRSHDLILAAGSRNADIYRVWNAGGVDFRAVGNPLCEMAKGRDGGGGYISTQPRRLGAVWAPHAVEKYGVLIDAGGLRLDGGWGTAGPMIEL